MIYQTSDPISLIDFAAEQIFANSRAQKVAGGDLQKSMEGTLVFVPTRRAARSLEQKLVQLSGGAAVLPKIIGLGETDDDEDEPEAISQIERKIILSDILLSVAGKVGLRESFQGIFPVAGEFVQLSDYLENEGLDAAAVNWDEYVADDRKRALLGALSAIDYGRPTSAQIRNAGQRRWLDRLGDFDRVFCIGSTGSVRATRELMEKISGMENGVVVLPGLCEFTSSFPNIGRTDPYYTIKEFLSDKKVETAWSNSGEKIKFMNACFSNRTDNCQLSIINYQLAEAKTEAEEAAAVALIAAKAHAENKTVLVITPDVAGGERIISAISKYDLSYDTTAGMPLSKTALARVVMLTMDYIIGAENKDIIQADLSKLCSRTVKIDKKSWRGDLYDFVFNIVSALEVNDLSEAETFFESVAELSGILSRHELEFADIAFLFKEFIGAVSIRPPRNDDAAVKIMGTAEARMQTADVVIITGLNEGMFPKDGFAPDWIPRNLAMRLVLLSPDSKVSLMALDFMTLSCGAEVYWTRAQMSGGKVMQPSRFLSRVQVVAPPASADDILATVRRMDDLPLSPIDKTPPSHIYKGVYYATWLEDLVHNPYQFYAKHILKLRRAPDIGDPIGPKEFGTLVHGVIETGEADEKKIVAAMESGARELLGDNSVLFGFWQKRFAEMAPAIAELLSADANAEIEKKITAKYQGRTLSARADRIENGRKIIDIKTGAAPNPKSLGLGRDANTTMPQLPASALILEEQGTRGIEMAILQLKRKNVKLIEYDAEQTAAAIAAVKDKLNYLFNITEYARPEHVEEKYRDFDDLARAAD